MISSVYRDRYFVKTTFTSKAPLLLQIVASGRRKGFFIFDLAASRVEQVQGILGRQEKSFESFVTCPTGSSPLVAFLGNEGCVPLVSLQSRQSVGTLKMNGTVRTAAFAGNGQQLLTAGELAVPSNTVFSALSFMTCQHVFLHSLV